MCNMYVFEEKKSLILTVYPSVNNFCLVFPSGGELQVERKLSVCTKQF